MDLILITFAILLAIAIGLDWSYWRHLAGSDWTWWNAEESKGEEKSDVQLRYEALRSAGEVDLFANPDEPIEEPDEYMENLIACERFNEAMSYRLDMLRIARSRGDKEMLHKYAVYGARIARAQAESESLKQFKLADELRRTKKPGKTEEPCKTAYEPPISPPERKTSPSEKMPKPPLWLPKTPEDTAHVHPHQIYKHQPMPENQPHKWKRKYFLEFRDKGAGKRMPPETPQEKGKTS